jgi:tRNA (cmo5U34)-methyltransferase
MVEISSQFTKTASEYDSWIRKVIPRYEEMLDTLVDSLPSMKHDGCQVIDLGCGTGSLSQKLLEAHPEVELICLDMASGMLDLAKERLQEYPNIDYVLSDLYDYEFGDNADLVISSLALHHLVTDQDKKMIYRRIFDNLRPGGSFLNADIVLGSDQGMQGLYLQRWIEFMDRSLPKDEVADVIQRYHREDSPAKLYDHLRWLDDAGFRSVDTIWKHLNFAIYYGKKI